ncbi:hypothetical protein [Cognatiluteimonas weifangensis]|uniref:hypothetical protein n=1 Tax=Cognatiluteimonas weifangensis TaxID=2303539 RepID=UPI0013143A61|nr:hypothetical protein [Luteimonas weifangensis]
MPLPVNIDVADLASVMTEGTARGAAWGRIVQLADPFGHGRCLLQFRGCGDDGTTCT